MPNISNLSKISVSKKSKLSPDAHIDNFIMTIIILWSHSRGWIETHLQMLCFKTSMNCSIWKKNFKMLVQSSKTLFSRDFKRDLKKKMYRKATWFHLILRKIALSSFKCRASLLYPSVLLCSLQGTRYLTKKEVRRPLQI